MRPDALAGWLAALHLGAIGLAIYRPRLAMAGVALLGVVQCALAFPRTATHLYLGVVVSLLLALLDPAEPIEARQLRRSALALPLIVFAWSGVQKAVHGFWFSGELLAWMIASRDDVALVTRPLLDDATAAQLGSFGRNVEGAGPFRLHGGWGVISNAVWLAELGSPLLAVWVRARLWAVLLLGLWTIQLVAHEWQFALLFTNLLLEAAPPRAQRIGRALTLAALAVLVVARATGLQLLPEGTS